ncbi:hypothetical protein ACTXG6_45795 [Pseudonocardia sp. Cha107L01]|uniref:hypothetical protein n=1 Tax=Pseudonocardia sp. Cha107L01 TaxID=3457576 RepID=UPI00403E42B8
MTVARYWNAIRCYLNAGDAWELSGFVGLAIGGYGSVPCLALVTDTDTIDHLALVGEIDVDQLVDHNGPDLASGVAS